MADDLKLSQLISKSLRHELSSEEARQVEDHLQSNEESRKFAELSRVIQESCAIRARDCESGETDQPGLSSEARQRLKDSVTEAIRQRRQQASDVPPEVSAEADPALESPVDPRPQVDTREARSRFQLLRRLSEGGLGNVWLARDKKLNRTLALKELKPDALQTPKAWDRFRREAEITGQLEHPNVVPVYQFGEDSLTGEPFYVMRFVGKRTLADAIVEYHDRVAAGEDCGMGLHRLLSVFLDVCQAIAYAHSRGVIHRDLKPENVALDNFGQVVVLDWGLAKVLEDSELAHKMTCGIHLEDVSFSATIQGDVVGTPLYMAPEQAAGDLEQVDHRTDVYGLGAILFAILTGKAPHENSIDERFDDLSQALEAIAQAETPRPGTQSHCVPRDLESICVKAMARKRHLRFDSVQEMSDSIERWIAGQSGKKASYDNLRMEGRELRTDLESAVRDLERNVRFMSSLPPIQELITASSDEDIAIWRERLVSIYQGLLRANPDYRNVVYSQVVDGQFNELVRVERQSNDPTTIRNVPRSRLRTGSMSEHLENLVSQKPGEVLSSLVCDPLCDKGENGCAGDVGLAVGVPVYDETTEDVFGVVMITCDSRQLLQDQLNRRLRAAEVVVACDVFHTMMHVRDGQILEDSAGRPIDEIAPHFNDAVADLQTCTEFIDEANSDVYGARLWLIPEQHGVMYLLKRSAD